MTRKNKKKRPLEDNNLANIQPLNNPHDINSINDKQCDENRLGILDELDGLDLNSSLNDRDTTDTFINEIDSFRQRWKRELGLNDKLKGTGLVGPSSDVPSEISDKISELDISERKSQSTSAKNSKRILSDFETSYHDARQLILKGIELKNKSDYNESIKLYQQAVKIHPGIAYEINSIECEASENQLFSHPRILCPAKENLAEPTTGDVNDNNEELGPLYDRIWSVHYNQEDSTLCKPKVNRKSELHISDLPRELIKQVVHHVIGEQLDLASLERLGLVSRGLFLLSRDQSIWRSICVQTWGKDILRKYSDSIDWRRIFLEKPRPNFDGVYISRTKYLRPGDVGFQDCTYRPFHMISYFRYIRFFADKRVIILTTNEDEHKILPIFRHAQDATQFSPELSVLEGTYEFDESSNHVLLVAEKNCRVNLSSRDSRRQAHQSWHIQTPLSRKFTLKFEVRTNQNWPYSNNVLRWIDYKILSRYEHNQELTSYDVTPEHFPNLKYCRVKMFNLRQNKPLLIS